MTIQKILKQARRQGWSDIALAERCGVGRETIRLARTKGRQMGFDNGWKAWEIVRDQVLMDGEG